MSRFPFDFGLCLLLAGSGCATPFVSSQLPVETPRRVEINTVSGEEVRANHSLVSSTMPVTVLGEGRILTSENAPPPRPEKPERSGLIAQVSQTNAIWTSSVKTEANHPIEVSRLGTGPDAVLILGSIYGNEPESIELMDAVAQLAKKVPPPASMTLLLVRTPNPDGFAEHIRTNQRGIDLNRNFPTPIFTTAPSPLTGPEPASELETQFLMRILQEYQPKRVVHLRSSIGQQPLLLMNEYWPQENMEKAVPSHSKLSKFQGEYKAGSLEEYVTRELHTPLTTVHLPPKGFQQLSALELLRYSTAFLSSSRENRAVTNRQDEMTRDISTSSPASRTDGRQGNVELLPPPPKLAPTSTGSPNASRFYELPPPPRFRRDS